MRLKPDTQLALLFIDSDEIKTNLIAERTRTVMSSKATEEIKQKAVTQVVNFISSDRNVNYLYTGSARAIIQKIKTDKLEPKFFAGLQVGKKITMMMGKEMFFRYEVLENDIACMYCTIEPHPSGRPYFKYTLFKIYTDDERNLFYHPERMDDPFSDEKFKFFIQALIFTEFSETQVKILKPNERTGTKKSGKYINDYNSDLVIVNSVWNHIVVRNQGFSVSGHFRLQAVGEKRSKRKLTYIEEFTKSGYIRGARKEQVN